MKKCTLILFLLLYLFNYKIFAEPFTLESSAFKLNTMIPIQNTCYKTDESPQLSWHDAPAKTQSFALIVEDPDSPNGVWTHWALFNIPAKITQLDAGAPIPVGAARAKNSWGGQDYRGPCPSLGVHRYIFKLYALDNVISLGDGTAPDLLKQAITGHVLESTELIGLYQKF